MERAIQLLKQDQEHLEKIIKCYPENSQYKEKEKRLKKDLKGIIKAIEILKHNNNGSN
ncbi:hypothetical protein [Riemerella columbina]|uniref:hypothetical protein n=1 Tax=Riemerella columbina TaxID=103810 RepID=UPI000371D3F0|nr:hypothetical protein [Riemerella columbina]